MKQVFASTEPSAPGLDGGLIVAFTAGAFGEDWQACAAARMSDFLPNPVDPDAMYTMLLKWLDRVDTRAS